MFTKQISVFLENKKGRLAELTKLLLDAGINIRAMTLVDTVDFGVLRLIVNEHDRCLKMLKQQDWAAQETDVLAAEIRDEPGSLHRVVETLGRSSINVEYMYTFYGKAGDNVMVVFKADNAASAAAALQKSGIRLLSEKAIGSL